MEASFVTHQRSSAPQASFSGFERFFREEYPAVVRIAFGVVGDAQAAQDVAQDVFISAFKRFPEPGESDHARAWVRAAAAHTALNAIRGERRRDRRQRSAAIEVPAAGPEETVLNAESRTEVRRALSRLPRKAAAVLVLRHNGLSYAEVADALNVKVGHVGTMLRRAESALRHRDQEADWLPAGAVPLGYLPELFRFQSWLTAREVLVLQCRLMRMARQGWAAAVDDALHVVGLDGRGDDKVGTFSKGMQQRLGLGVALLGEPALVVLDEPTSALDPVGRHHVRVIIRELRDRGATVFLNTHLLEEAEHVCDRVTIISKGRSVATGTLAELKVRRPSARLSALAAGVVGIALFGLAWLAGVGGTLATAFNIHALHTASEVSQYLLPTNGLWQGAIYYLEPSSFVTQQLAGSPVGQGDPFLALTAPPWQYLVWAGIWLVLVLTLGLVSFERREL